MFKHFLASGIFVQYFGNLKKFNLIESIWYHCLIPLFRDFSDEILTGSGSYPFTLRKVAIVPNYSTQNNNNNNSVNNVNSSNLFQNGSNFSNNQPFSLKCWTCPWYNICKGCPLELSEDIFEPPPNLQSLVNDGGTNSNSSSSTNHNGAQNGVGGGVKNVNGSGGGASCFPSSTVYVLAIEWEPTIIHLRFNFAAENVSF